ncbi:MAG: hypothetical protein LBD28_02605 [Tannerellaceae bacterium]|jgi:hypothetical protein|nr:hypothetical protein [Tannerellaceae bacterium]
MKRILLSLIAATFAIIAAQAQLTIGSDKQPARAALLELKTQEPGNPASTNDPANITSDKGGLMLPRVMLVDTATLEPFIATNDPDWINNARTKIKETHAGLTVYNLTDNAMFSPRVYYWNGTRWNAAWPFPDSANEGLTIIGDTMHLGGTITKDATLNTNGHAINLAGSAPLQINMPVTLTDSLIYTYGNPGDGKIIVADENGIGTWQNNNAMKTTPAASLSANGARLTPSNWKDVFRGTGTFLTVPPGQWLVIVTMHVDLKGGNGSDCVWVRSGFVRQGQNDIEPRYYVGKNQMVSGRVYSGKNVISGFVVMKNDTNASIRFEYQVGKVETMKRSMSNNLSIENLGGRAFGENAIVAFALK